MSHYDCPQIDCPKELSQFKKVGAVLVSMDYYLYLCSRVGEHLNRIVEIDTTF